MGVSVVVEGGVARLEVSHPPLNILTRAVLTEFRGALAQAAGDQTLRVLLVTAAGRHFSAGADVGEHLPGQFEALIPEFTDTIVALDAFPVPVVVAVQGRCLGGGCELVQAADLVVAGEGAVFGQPEIALGVVPPAACALLPRRAGSQGAAALVFTGDPLPAAEAQRLGLVWRVVSDADVGAAALEVAGRIARHSAATLRLAKRALRMAGTGETGAALRAAAELYVRDVMRTRDALEGLAAFVEKREPAWSHR
jgi:cyclohexa-1,5-dienecarbonyl-CoA hydratase